MTDAAPSEKTTTETPPSVQMPPVIKFLLGEGKLDGCGFGEFPDDGKWPKRRYWWRKALREAWDTRTPQPDEKGV